MRKAVFCMVYMLSVMVTIALAQGAQQPTTASPMRPGWETPATPPVQGAAMPATIFFNQLTAFYGEGNVQQQPGGTIYVSVDDDDPATAELEINQDGRVLNAVEAAYRNTRVSISVGGPDSISTATYRQGQYVTAFARDGRTSPQFFSPTLHVTRVTPVMFTFVMDGQEISVNSRGFPSDASHFSGTTADGKKVTIDMLGDNAVMVTEGDVSRFYYQDTMLGSGTMSENADSVYLRDEDGQMKIGYSNGAFLLYDNGEPTHRVFTQGPFAGGQIDLRDLTDEGYGIVTINGQRGFLCTAACDTNNPQTRQLQYTHGFLDCGKSSLSPEDCTKASEALDRSITFMERFRGMARGAAAGEGICFVLTLFKADCGDTMFQAYDDFMQTTVLGNVLSGDTSKLCQVWTDSDTSQDVAITPSGGAAAWVAAEATKIRDPETDALSFLYKITFDVTTSGIVESGCENEIVSFLVELDGNVLDINLNADTSDDIITVRCDSSGFRATGSRTIVRYYPQRFQEICIRFRKPGDLNGFFRAQLENGKLCNRIADAGVEYEPGECGWCIFGSGGHPDEENEPNVEEHRPDVVNP